MSLRKYLMLMVFASAICWTAFVLVVNNLNPYSTGILGFVFFYVSLFLAIVGTFSLIGFVVRSRVLKEEMAFRHVAISFRQGLWFGLLACLSLWLQSKTLLTWFNLLLLVLVLVVIEFFFLSMQRQSYVEK